MIKDKMYPEATSPEEKKRMLQVGCYKKEQENIKKYFSEAEHLQMRKDFMAYAIKIDKLKEELKVIVDDFNSRIKPLADVNTQLKIKVDAGYEEVPGDVFLFDYQEQGMMAYYDENGDLIRSRRFSPEERQLDVASEAAKA
jgi:hypothetical protein